MYDVHRACMMRMRYAAHMHPKQRTTEHRRPFAARSACVQQRRRQRSTRTATTTTADSGGITGPRSMAYQAAAHSRHAAPLSIHKRASALNARQRGYDEDVVAATRQQCR